MSDQRPEGEPVPYCEVTELLTVEEAAEFAKVSVWTMWDWLNKGRVPKRQPGGRGTSVRVAKEDLLRVAPQSGSDQEESQADSEGEGE